MKFNNNNKIIITTILLSAIAYATYLFFKSKRIKVSIYNTTDKPIKDLQIKFDGGKTNISTVNPNKNVQTNINPKNETTLGLSYKQNNILYDKELAIYIGKSYKSTINIYIKDNGNLNWEAQIAPK